VVLSSSVKTQAPLASLKRCEDEFRNFAAEAAADGDYDLLARLGTIARTMSEIANEWDMKTRDQIDPAENSDPPKSDLLSTALSAETVRGRGVRSAAGRGYPRFVRRGNELVKIGWSKGEGKEYQHRAPHGLLVALRQSLLDASRHRRLFRMDALSAQSAPGYQAYAWLAWLRSAGLVKQHGRQGYSVVKPASFEADVDRVFAEVPLQEL